MKKIILLCLVFPGFAWADWKPEVGDASAEATIEEGALTAEGGLADASADANAQATSNSEGGEVGDVTNNNSTEIINPDDIKLRNTPGVAMGSSRGNAGVSFSIPGFGFGINAPWRKEDEKKGKWADRLWAMGAYAAARKVSCETATLKAVFESEEACFVGLGGDSIPEGK